MIKEQLKKAKNDLNKSSRILKISNTTQNWLIYKENEKNYNELFAKYIKEGN